MINHPHGWNHTSVLKPSCESNPFIYVLVRYTTTHFKLLYIEQSKVISRPRHYPYWLTHCEYYRRIIEWSGYDLPMSKMIMNINYRTKFNIY